MARFSPQKPNTARFVGKLRKPPARNTYGVMLIGNVQLDLQKVNDERDTYGLPHLARNDARRKAEGWSGKGSLHSHLVERPAHLGPDTSEYPPAAPAKIITANEPVQPLRVPLVPLPREE